MSHHHCFSIIYKGQILRIFNIGKVTGGDKPNPRKAAIEVTLKGSNNGKRRRNHKKRLSHGKLHRQAVGYTVTKESAF